MSMTGDRTRRQFLRRLSGVGIAVGAGMAGLRIPAVAQPDDKDLTATPLRGGLVQISGAGGNVVALGGPDGVAMVDSGAPESEARLMRFVAERFDGAPVGVLFNTHWRLDHTGGNEAVGEAGARIIAHENTRLWMSTEFYVDWEDRTYPPRPEHARPTETFYTSDPQPIELEIGGRRIVYGHLDGAHTDGDIYVFFPEENVIAAGAAVTVGSYPVMDYYTGGWIGGLIESTAKLIDMADADTLIVPKSGPAQSREYLRAQRDMLSEVRERVESMALEGKGPDEMHAAGITADFDERWGENSRLFLSNVYEGLWWSDMRGIVA